MARGRCKSGLVRRGKVFHIDMRIGGERVCMSTGETERQRAQEVQARLVRQHQLGSKRGEHLEWTFAQAVEKYLEAKKDKRSIRNDRGRLQQMLPAFGTELLAQINMGTLTPWIEYLRSTGRKTATINQYLALVRCILNMASCEWFDAYGRTWIAAAPKIKLLKVTDDKKTPYLTVEMQNQFISELATHLQPMAYFAANTGCRESEICSLRWGWEQRIPELGTSAFVIPGDHVKNGEPKLVILNRYARMVVEGQRGKHPTHVFCFKGKPVTRMYNSSWTRVRNLTGIAIGAHTFRHAFGARLRAADVHEEDRAELLGHKRGSMTTHYSKASIERLIELADRVAPEDPKDIPEPAVTKGIVIG